MGFHIEGNCTMSETPHRQNPGDFCAITHLVDDCNDGPGWKDELWPLKQKIYEGCGAVSFAKTWFWQEVHHIKICSGAGNIYAAMDCVEQQTVSIVDGVCQVNPERLWDFGG